MRDMLTCPWCDALNFLEVRFCEECGHETWVERSSDCQCPACITSEQMRFLIHIINEQFTEPRYARPEDDPFTWET